MIRAGLLLFFISCISLSGWTQQNNKPDSLISVEDDSLITQSRDTVLLKSYATRYDPRKALLYAAVLPGLGQIYNKKYWKLPLVYGGMGLLAYNINMYEKGYTKYKLRLFHIIDGEPDPEGYDEATMRNAVTRYRRERDFMIIIMGLVYVLQIVDAHVDAHLKEFDLNPALQVRLRPMMKSDIVLGRQAGFTLSVKF